MLYNSTVLLCITHLLSSTTLVAADETKRRTGAALSPFLSSLATFPDQWGTTATKDTKTHSYN